MHWKQFELIITMLRLRQNEEQGLGQSRRRRLPSQPHRNAMYDSALFPARGRNGQHAGRRIAANRRPADADHPAHRHHPVPLRAELHGLLRGQEEEAGHGRGE